MSRRSKPPNRVGCKPDEDVCVEHDRPLECRHGCKEATAHVCACTKCNGFGWVGDALTRCPKCSGSGRQL
jgi:hypothetical protein